MNAFDLNLRVKLQEKNAKKRNLSNIKDFLEDKNREREIEKKYETSDSLISNCKLYKNKFIDKLEYSNLLNNNDFNNNNKDNINSNNNYNKKISKSMSRDFSYNNEIDSDFKNSFSYQRENR
jgi:hypothetical protein